jgi:hypothetical protein
MRLALVIATAVFVMLVIILALSGVTWFSRRGRERRLRQEARTRRVPRPCTASEELGLSMRLALHPQIEAAAYNASCLVLSSGVLVRSFRVSSFTRRPGSKSEWYYHHAPRELGSRIVLQWTTHDATREVLLHVPEPLDVQDSPLSFVPGYEDPRLVEWRGRLLCLVNARSDGALGKARMYLIDVCAVSEVTSSLGGTHTGLEELDRSPRHPPTPREWPCRVARLVAPDEQPEDAKNWIAVVWQGRLFLVYSLVPHALLEVPLSSAPDLEAGTLMPSPDGSFQIRCLRVLGAGDVTRFSKWDPNESVELPDGHSLPLWRLRGGTGVVLVDAKSAGTSRDLHVGVAHFRSRSHYYSVWYALGAEPPFELVALSAPGKLGEHVIEYPCGLRQGGDRLVVSYGVDDSSAREVSFAAKDVLGCLVAR